MRTVFAVARAIYAMHAMPEAISVSRTTMERMADDFKNSCLVVNDDRYANQGMTVCGVKVLTFARDDIDPNTIDIRDLDGNILIRVVGDDHE